MLRSFSLAAAVLLLSAGSASALTFSFDCIKAKNSKSCQTGRDQLSVEVLGDTNQVSFAFSNTGPKKISANALFVDDTSGTLDRLLNVFNSANTNFDQGGEPHKLPNQKKVNFEPDFRATAQNPTDRTRLTPGGVVTLNFVLASGKTLDDVLAAIEASDLRLGIRTGKSFINVPSGGAVPEPGVLALLALGAPFALRGRRS